MYEFRCMVFNFEYFRFIWGVFENTDVRILFIYWFGVVIGRRIWVLIE